MSNTDQAILLIDTSTNSCSIAISIGEEVIAEEFLDSGQAHSAVAAGFVQKALESAALTRVAAVAVSEGPGSYTGLRIGASLAKGLAFGWGVPLIAIPTLEILAEGVRLHCKPSEGFICPLIDARRMEVYTALYDNEAKALEAAKAMIIEANSFSEELARGKVYFVGDGAEKLKRLIQNVNAIFIDELTHPRANAMATLAAAHLQSGKTADLAYWQPYYLKAYEAVIGKNKVLEQAKKDAEK